jgi:hypothetical protein
LGAGGAATKVPLFLLPSLRRLFGPAEIKSTVAEGRGGKIEHGAPGTWKFLPNEKEEEASFEVSGDVPADAQIGDIILVNVAAHYPAVKRTPARTVEFLEFVYVAKREK